MSTDEQQRLMLYRIIELAESMLENALMQKWETVIELQEIRDPLIYDFFSAECVLDKQLLAENIQSILEIDKQLIEMGQLERNDLNIQLNKMSKGKSVVKAYSNL